MEKYLISYQKLQGQHGLSMLLCQVLAGEGKGLRGRSALAFELGNGSQ